MFAPQTPINCMMIMRYRFNACLSVLCVTLFQEYLRYTTAACYPGHFQSQTCSLQVNMNASTLLTWSNAGCLWTYELRHQTSELLYFGIMTWDTLLTVSLHHMIDMIVYIQVITHTANNRQQILLLTSLGSYVYI